MERENQQDRQERNQSHQPGFSRARQVVEQMAQPLGFRDVASQELKRFAVWGPALFTTLVGAGWSLIAINKKFG